MCITHLSKAMSPRVNHLISHSSMRQHYNKKKAVSTFKEVILCGSHWMSGRNFMTYHFNVVQKKIDADAQHKAESPHLYSETGAEPKLAEIFYA